MAGLISIQRKVLPMSLQTQIELAAPAGSVTVLDFQTKCPPGSTLTGKMDIVHGPSQNIATGGMSFNRA